MENITRGTKRPAEPGAKPEFRTQLTTTTGAQPTFRMSGIPICLTEDVFSNILEGLGPFQDVHIDDFSQPAAKLHRRSNVHSISLAPSASAPDSDKYQVATVTFNKIPPALAACVPKTETHCVSFTYDGGEIEVDVDTHFHGLTPLNSVPNPSVEYVVPLILVPHRPPRIIPSRWLNQCCV